MSSWVGARRSRDLHPVAWWLWAIGLAAAASATTNPWFLLLLVGVASLVVMTCRSDQPWGRSFRLYVYLGVLIVVLRVLFRLVFGGTYGTTVWLDLPEIPLPDFVLGLTLLGPITRESLLFGLYDGLRLATIVICIGAANSLANPKRLLRSVPPALYEIGTALVVAVSVLPQFADSVRRVRAAQRLRAGQAGRVRGLRRLVVPVLEDALERSLALAAGMDARGYGRAPGLTRAQRRRTGALMVVGLCGVCVGTYAVLDRTAPRVLALPMLALGLLLAVAGLVSAGRRVQRTRYRPDPWRLPETGVAACGVAVGVVGFWLAERQPMVAFPDPAFAPALSLTALLGALVGLGALLLAPPPRMVEQGPPPRTTTSSAAAPAREEVPA
ncbi:energy-coupling factor transporter transmembrane component T [Nocardioides nanhaiensis]|uniref:CbiQ family ECF transporter T component n=1 Tax=Nocardioides nanhaiensis TaxID=1476871 RepID=A0ABP8W511_9ACTN